MQTQDFFSIKKTLYLNFNIFEKILSFLVATWQCLSPRVCSHADKWRNKQEKYHCCPFSCAYTFGFAPKSYSFSGWFFCPLKHSCTELFFDLDKKKSIKLITLKVACLVHLCAPDSWHCKSISFPTSKSKPLGTSVSVFSSTIIFQ